MESVPRYQVYIAGGNMGGDCDQHGEPVVDGLLYIAKVYGDEAETVAGPFASLIHANKACDRLTESLPVRAKVEEAKAALDSGDYRAARTAIFDLLVLTGEDFGKLAPEIAPKRDAAPGTEHGQIQNRVIAGGSLHHGPFRLFVADGTP